MAIGHGPLYLIYPSKMVIFHSYVSLPEGIASWFPHRTSVFACRESQFHAIRLPKSEAAAMEAGAHPSKNPVLFFMQKRHVVQKREGSAKPWRVLYCFRYASTPLHLVTCCVTKTAAIGKEMLGQHVWYIEETPRKIYVVFPKDVPRLCLWRSRRSVCSSL